MTGPGDPLLTPTPGEHLEHGQTPHGIGTATYDPTRRYRYRLSRIWEPDRGRCCFVMLNPSTATALTLDPTVTRCHRYAERWGYGALEVVNIFALRATDPRELYRETEPVGEGNDTAILAAGAAADIVVAAWGTHGKLRGRGAEVQALLQEHGVEINVLRTTRDGHPNHPLYLHGDLRPRRW